MDPQIAGLAALYAVIELVKFFVTRYHRNHSLLTEKERYYLINLHKEQGKLGTELAEHFKSTAETANDAKTIIKTLDRIEQKTNSKQ